MIDILADHESFLRAIYDDPEDDTVRLVYADFLEEHGESERAAVIRRQCDQARRGCPAHVPVGPNRLAGVRVRLTVRTLDPAADYERGFPRPARTIDLSADLLADPAGFREWTVRSHPEYFGAVEVRVTDGPLSANGQLETLLAAPALARVRRLNLRGEQRWVARAGRNDVVRSVVAESRLEPVITAAGVEVLADSPGSRRLRQLNLGHNRLNDRAARALADSPHLGSLERLEIARGNHISGEAWQVLLRRFGSNVVG